jgi:putative ABC transport system substrate-binding protein
MKRREFIAGLVSAAAWPVMAVRAEQSALPVIGFLSSGTPETYAPIMAEFHAGLREADFFDGRNVAIEYRWAHDEYDRVLTLATDLVERRVDVIVAGPRCEQAAKSATTNIPIVVLATGDPIRTGLVDSLSRPGGNLTGTTLFTMDLTGKRLGFLHQMTPQAAVIAYVRDATVPSTSSNQVFELEQLNASARNIGVTIRLVTAGNDFDETFAAVVRDGAGAAYLGASAYFFAQRDKLTAAAARHRIPASYDNVEHVAAGGLMSYGVSVSAAFRLVGVYAGRVLKGEKAGDLPFQLPTKFDFAVNLKTAKTLGLEIPPNLLAVADEVIE